MSDQAMAWARGVRVSTSSQKLVLYVLANHATRDGVVHSMGQGDIAEEAVLSERQVRTILAQLERMGIVERERQNKRTGREKDVIRLRMAEMPMILGAHRKPLPVAPPEAIAAGATGNRQSVPPAETAAGLRAKGLREAHRNELPLGEPTGNPPHTPLEFTPPLAPLKGGISPPRAKADRGTRLPESWEITPQLIAHAADHGFTEHEARFVADRFRAYWTAETGQKARKLNWDQAFRVWIGRENARQVREAAARWRATQGAGGWDVAPDVAATRVQRWRANPEAWNEYAWGPPPDQPGFRGPAHLRVEAPLGRRSA